MLSACYVIHLKPPLYLRNALPIDVHISVAGCSVSQTGKNVETNFYLIYWKLCVFNCNFNSIFIYWIETNALTDESTNKDELNESKPKEDFLDYGEKVVKPGDILHLPTIKTTMKEGENKTLIVARVNIKCLTNLIRCDNNLYSMNFSSFNIWRKTGLAPRRFHQIRLNLLYGRLHRMILLKKCQLNWVSSKKLNCGFDVKKLLKFVFIFADLITIAAVYSWPSTVHSGW